MLRSSEILEAATNCCQLFGQQLQSAGHALSEFLEPKKCFQETLSRSLSIDCLEATTPHAGFAVIVADQPAMAADALLTPHGLLCVA